MCLVKGQMQCFKLRAGSANGQCGRSAPASFGLLTIHSVVLLVVRVASSEECYESYEYCSFVDDGCHAYDRCRNYGACAYLIVTHAIIAILRCRHV